MNKYTVALRRTHEETTEQKQTQFFIETQFFTILNIFERRIELQKVLV